MANSFFNGAFFDKGFFSAESAPVKKGSNWHSKRKQDDEVVLMAVLHSYMKLQERHYHVG